MPLFAAGVLFTYYLFLQATHFQIEQSNAALPDMLSGSNSYGFVIQIAPIERRMPNK